MGIVQPARLGDATGGARLAIRPTVIVRIWPSVHHFRIRTRDLDDYKVSVRRFRLSYKSLRRLGSRSAQG
jgi:hypothetical protein